MKKFLLGTAVGLGTLAAASVAQALPTYSTGSFAITGFTSTTTDVTTTTSFTLTPPALATGSAVGDFASVSLPALLSITSPLVFTTPGAASFDFADAGLGTFTATSAKLLGIAHIGASATASYNVVGTFVLGSDWANAGASFTADETWALGQTGGAGNSISMSGTFHAPAEKIATPEPATIAVAGVVLAAFGARRRKK